jgi:hypothetical protein
MMRCRLWTNLGIVSLAITLVAVFLWLLSFRLEYFPPALLLFKWRPTEMTPQFQCLWLVSAPATLLFALLARRARQEMKRRARLGLCLQCGYDLRASSGCCPECGAVLTTHAERRGRAGG